MQSEEEKKPSSINCLTKITEEIEDHIGVRYTAIQTRKKKETDEILEKHIYQESIKINQNCKKHVEYQEIIPFSSSRSTLTTPLTIYSHRSTQHNIGNVKDEIRHLLNHGRENFLKSYDNKMDIMKYPMPHKLSNKHASIQSPSLTRLKCSNEEIQVTLDQSNNRKDLIHPMTASNAKKRCSLSYEDYKQSVEYMIKRKEGNYMC